MAPGCQIVLSHRKMDNTVGINVTSCFEVSKIILALVYNIFSFPLAAVNLLSHIFNVTCHNPFPVMRVNYVSWYCNYSCINKHFHCSPPRPTRAIWRVWQQQWGSNPVSLQQEMLHITRPWICHLVWFATSSILSSLRCQTCCPIPGCKRKTNRSWPSMASCWHHDTYHAGLLSRTCHSGLNATRAWLRCWCHGSQIRAQSYGRIRHPLCGQPEILREAQGYPTTGNTGGRRWHGRV